MYDRSTCWNLCEMSSWVKQLTVPHPHHGSLWTGRTYETDPLMSAVWSTDMDTHVQTHSHCVLQNYLFHTFPTTLSVFFKQGSPFKYCNYLISNTSWDLYVFCPIQSIWLFPSVLIIQFTSATFLYKYKLSVEIISNTSNNDTIGFWPTRPKIPKGQFLMSWEWD